jgi:CelD/BcsL family acetyltransferase involved in cellulose biosynthesis
VTGRPNSGEISPATSEAGRQTPDTRGVTATHLAASNLDGAEAKAVHSNAVTVNANVTEVNIELQPIEVAGLAVLEREWRELEGRATSDSIYTSFDWLRAWAEVYRPRRLVAMRAVDTDDNRTAALGLIEIDRVREWRFAGGAQTPRRAPLCANGYEDAVWKALGKWLRSHPHAWSTLHAAELGPGAEALPHARMQVRHTPCRSLPDSFDSYLASLTSKRRGDARRRLRLIDQVGIEIREVMPGELERAIEDFIRLHHRRADTKRETRLNLDNRLDKLLMRIQGAASLDLTVFEMRHCDERIGLNVVLERGGIVYLYSHGWDPAAARFAPGIVMALETIRYAIDRGMLTIDMGPGEQRYKLDLGFTPDPRLMLEAYNPLGWARALRIAADAYARLRR